MSVVVRKMKKATMSSEASLFSHIRSSRTSLVGRPATWRTRTRSRATLNVRRRRSFSGIVSPLGGAIATSRIRAPARSIVTVRSTVALPSFTWASPVARRAGGPSSRSSRAVTVSSSQESPPLQPISTRSGIGTWATAAPDAATRRTLASGGEERLVATVLIGTWSSAPSARSDSGVTPSGGSSSRPSLTTMRDAGCSSGELASAFTAAVRSLRGARASEACGGPSRHRSLVFFERAWRAVAEAEH